MATDRGIGVAVITSTCGRVVALALSAARCSTPNRCCSSTTTRPRSANCTPALSSAWVPITIPASPEAARRVASRRWAVDWEPVTSTTPVAFSTAARVPPSARSPSSRVTVEKCWAASTSVGASSAACPPASTTASMARSATRVLPEPTSPWSSRCMGKVRASSAKICSLTSTWPAVRVNGSRASNASSSPPVRRGRGSARWEAASARR